MDDTVSSPAARQLAASGVKLHVGEAVSCIITATKDKVKEWRPKPPALLEGALEHDAKKYLGLIGKTAHEILAGLKDGIEAEESEVR